MSGVSASSQPFSDPPRPPPTVKPWAGRSGLHVHPDPDPAGVALAEHHQGRRRCPRRRPRRCWSRCRGCRRRWCPRRPRCRAGAPPSAPSMPGVIAGPAPAEVFEIDRGRVSLAEDGIHGSEGVVAPVRQPRCRHEHVREPVAVEVARRSHPLPGLGAVSAPAGPSMRKPRLPMAPRSTLAAEPPKTTYAAPASRRPRGSANGAPTITSGIPSPFTSPAAATDVPALSPAAAPVSAIAFLSEAFGVEPITGAR